jgi:hypothetical protein
VKRGGFEGDRGPVIREINQRYAGNDDVDANQQAKSEVFSGARMMIGHSSFAIVCGGRLSQRDSLIAKGATRN